MNPENTLPLSTMSLLQKAYLSLDGDAARKGARQAHNHRIAKKRYIRNKMAKASRKINRPVH